MQYNFWRSLLKAIVKGTLFMLPVAMTLLPAVWMNMTLGTAFYMVIDWCQKKYTTL